MPKSLLQQQERDELVALCMKNAQESIFIADEAGALIEVNEWFLRTLGYDAKDLPSLHVWDIDTNVTEATWPEICRQIPGKTDITFTSYRIAKDGKEIPVKVCKHFVEYKGRNYVFSRSQPTQQTEKDANILPFFEERYQSFINNFQGIAYESTIDWVPVLFKGQVEEMTGYTGEEFLAGTPRWDEIIYPDDLREIKSYDSDLRTVPGTKMDREYRIVRKDGTLRWIHDSIQSVPDTTGTSLMLVGSLIDITEYRRVVDTLRKERDFADSIVGTAQTIVLVLDTEGHIVYFNPYMEEISGYILEEVKGKDWFETFLPSHTQESVRSLFRKAIGDIQTSGNVSAIVSKDGHERLIEWYDKTLRNTDGSIAGLLATGQDITEKKEAEKALRENRKKYKDLVENLNEVIFTLDMEGKFTYLSPVVETLKGGFGYTVEDLKGKNFTEILHPDDVPEVMAKYRATLAGNPKTSEFRVIAKSGDIRWIQESGQPIKQDGRVVGLQGLFTDVTEKKNIEEELRKIELESRAVAEISDNAIFILDSDLKIERFNSKFAECMQIDPESPPGRDLSDLLTGDCYEHCRSLSLEVMQTNAPSEREVLVTLPEESRWFRIRIAPLTIDGTSDRFLVYATDIHEITLLKLALEETNKKLNMLTGVLRHDILNYLMVIMTGAEMIEIQTEHTPELSKNLHFIEEGTDAIERLLIFSREYQSLGIKEPRWYRVDKVIEEVMKDRMFAGVTIDLKMDGYSIFIDPLFYRVIYNLFENAIRHGESVTTITVRFSTENATGILTVRDDGVGICEEEKGKIFDEKYGKHTGFGLFFVREILDITGITIAETGTYGEGAVFEMRIPEGRWRKDEDFVGSEKSD